MRCRPIFHNWTKLLTLGPLLATRYPGWTYHCLEIATWRLLLPLNLTANTIKFGVCMLVVENSRRLANATKPRITLGTHTSLILPLCFPRSVLFRFFFLRTATVQALTLSGYDGQMLHCPIPSSTGLFP
ncbi:hypothetical protein BJY04DRAFT_48526 [Aspergillus karnatakaensis]|uniref:uncharacterized protein n=1 Tax=Aspergillus karnatakaensis TaxID=1810916 RepID=UPI003CCD802F